MGRLKNDVYQRLIPACALLSFPRRREPRLRRWIPALSFINEYFKIPVSLSHG